MQERQRVYTVLRKALHLTVVDGSEVAPTDISYVHSVYAPLSVRLAQHMAQPGGWRGLADVLPLLPGPTLDKAQDLPPGQAHRRKYQFYNFQCGVYSKFTKIKFVCRLELGSLNSSRS